MKLRHHILSRWKEAASVDIMALVIRLLPRRISDRVKSAPLGHRLASSTFWSLVGSVLARSLSVPTAVAVARLLGRHDYGELGIVYSSVELFGIFGGFGLGMTATKYVAEYRSKQPERAGRILTLSTLTAGVTGAIFAAGLYFLAPQLAAGPLAAPWLASSLRISAFLLFLNAVDGAQTGALAGFEAFSMLARLQLFKGFISFPFMVGGYFLGRLNGVLWGVVLARFAGYVVNRIALHYEARKFGVPLELRNCMAEISVLWKFSIPALLGGAMVAPVSWLCSTMLVNIPNGYREMGSYNAANQWYMTMLFIPTALASGLLPILSDTLGGKDLKKSGRVLSVMLKLNAIIVIPCVIVMSLLSPLIMRLYGHEYRAAWPTLVAVIVTAGIYAILTPVGEVIAASGRMWLGFAMNAGWAAVYVTCTYFFVHWGSIGLASARLSAYAVHATWTFAFAYLLVLRSRDKKSTEAPVPLAGTVE